ncbi:hypothetical protein IWQ60_009924 [Tieghemiomyces parasiticus]|uniref:RING-type domain-containing protein n=1 Tax=Tieghemiomyces parasiticus TaxID=78921 RepID=A0A9W8DKD6_9FUNG|nr:hypothetical protein IWQ60_009924 [Tieghemiomyces parasiticus]
MPFFPATNAVGTQIGNQLSIFQQDPSGNDEKSPGSARQNSTLNDYPQDWDGNYYHRVWGRIEFGGITSIITIIGAICFTLLRARRAKRRAAIAKKVAKSSQNNQRIQALLAKPVRTRNAPALNANQLRQLPSVSFTDETRCQFRFCTAPAIQRFKVAANTLGTSSDEDSDSDGDEFSPSGKSAEKSRYLDDANGTGPASLVFTNRSEKSSGFSGTQSSSGDYMGQLSTGDSMIVTTLPSPKLLAQSAREPGTLPIMAQMMTTVSAKRKSNPSVLATSSSAPIEYDSASHVDPAASTATTDTFALQDFPLASLATSSSGEASALGSRGTGRTQMSSINASRTRIPKTTTYESIMTVLRKRNLAGPAQCPVCEDLFSCGEVLRMLPCSHAFHGGCIDKWLTTRTARCPLCKYNSTPGHKPPPNNGHVTSMGNVISDAVPSRFPGDPGADDCSSVPMW